MRAATAVLFFQFWPALNAPAPELEELVDEEVVLELVVVLDVNVEAPLREVMELPIKVEAATVASELVMLRIVDVADLSSVAPLVASLTTSEVRVSKPATAPEVTVSKPATAAEVTSPATLTAPAVTLVATLAPFDVATLATLTASEVTVFKAPTASDVTVLIAPATSEVTVLKTPATAERTLTIVELRGDCKLNSTERATSTHIYRVQNGCVHSRNDRHVRLRQKKINTTLNNVVECENSRLLRWETSSRGSGG